MDKYVYTLYMRKHILRIVHTHRYYIPYMKHKKEHKYITSKYALCTHTHTYSTQSTSQCDIPKDPQIMKEKLPNVG